MLADKHNLWDTFLMVRIPKEYRTEFGRRGAKARAEALSPERRKQIARKAAVTRWAKKKAGQK